MRKLIRAGAALDVKDKRGNTAPLASWVDHFHIVRELNRAGAALDVKDADGQTALQIVAQMCGRAGIVARLEEAEASE